MSTAAVPVPNPDPDWQELARLVTDYCGAANRRLVALDRHVAANEGKWPPLTEDDVRRMVAEEPWMAPLVAKHRPDLVSPAVPTKPYKDQTPEERQVTDAICGLMRGSVPPKGRKRKPQPSYGASPIKRKRATKDEMAERLEQVADLARLYQPCTVRGVFYQMVGRDWIEKTEAGCTKVQNALMKLRMDGAVPWDWIIDESRIYFKRTSHRSPEEALIEWQSHYHRDLWASAPVTVQVWIEKRALAGLFTDALHRYDVPVFPSVGYTSDSFVRTAVDFIDHRPVFVYYFGDYDPSGMNISEVLERKLAYHAPEADIKFERMAINRDQIEEWDLPTRPTKKDTKDKKGDSRARAFGDDRSVELDAVDPNTLRELAECCVLDHLDAEYIKRIRQAERAEREALKSFIESWPGGAA